MTALLTDLYQLTMAHSFVQAHRSERKAFEDFARARPHRPVMLVDTYDTEAAVAKVIDLYPKLAAEGIHIGGVRLDSGDLAAHAKAVRAMLDAAGLRKVIVFASGNLDEQRIARLLADAAGDGEPLLQPVMRAGRRLPSSGTLAQARTRCAAQLARLPEALRALETVASPYPVEISDTLRALAREVDAATA